jgi:hypothetical protein
LNSKIIQVLPFLHTDQNGWLAAASKWPRAHALNAAIKTSTGAYLAAKSRETEWGIVGCDEPKASMALLVSSICFTPTASKAELTGVEGGVKEREKPVRGVSGMVGGE